MLKAILFDLDGTVLDSKPGIFRSAAYSLGQLGLPMPSDEDMMAFLGPPLSEGFLNVCHVPVDKVGDAVRLYREYYTNNNGMFDASIFDGVRELLTSLRQRGYLCCVTTSKPQVYACRILEHFRCDQLFDGIYGCELDGTRGHKSEVVAYCLEQHHLSNEETVLVGDRHFDVNGAKALGIPCIGVLYGYGTKDELYQAGAVSLAEKPEEILQIIAKL